MIQVLFTLDYEIHGNGDGCPHQLIVEPTQRMLDQFDQYGAKLTIMADVAEILKFAEFRNRTGEDRFHYDAISRQLQDALRRGHDVQLHLHCSYFNARFEKDRWIQDWSEYNFAGLSESRMQEVIRIGKDYLETLLRAVDPSYRCYVFRAANWAVSPSHKVVRALLANQFQVDTSVFKFGKRHGLVRFDYSNAHSNLVPWRVSPSDICQQDPQGQLIEFPIYCEHRGLAAFVTPQRVYRACLGRLHRLQNHQAPPAEPGGPDTPPGGKGFSPLRWLTQKHAWKADFNQCSGRQLIRALERAAAQYNHNGTPLPFVAIGHSKLFTLYNQRSLQVFLQHVSRHPDQFGFATFDAFDLNAIA